MAFSGWLEARLPARSRPSSKTQALDSSTLAAA
jgi:hypothetical protein